MTLRPSAVHCAASLVGTVDPGEHVIHNFVDRLPSLHFKLDAQAVTNIIDLNGNHPVDDDAYVC
jgi:hypothetical protein